MRLRYRPLPAKQEYALASASTPSFHLGEAFYPSQLSVDQHAHKNHSVTLVLQGSLTETYARNRAERCPPFTALFRPASEPHCDVMGDRGSLNLEIELIAPSLLDSPKMSSLFQKPARSMHPRLCSIAQQIHLELSVRDTAQACILEGLSLELLGVASRVNADMEARSHAPRWLSRVRELLHAHCLGPVRISELATLAEVHPVYLARAFRAHYGVTPGIYLRRLRLEWAARQLNSVAMEPLSAIAAAAGFSDQSHFTRSFKRYFGVSPGEMRRIGPLKR